MSKYTAAGLVATTPRHLITTDGMAITSFRLAETHTKADGGEETNWLTITGFGDLAYNMAASINKGERVLVSGELRVRDWDNGERAGTSVEIELDTIGHDLSWGTAQFVRTILKKRTPKEQADEVNAKNAERKAAEELAKDSLSLALSGYEVDSLHNSLLNVLDGTSVSYEDQETLRTIVSRLESK